MFSRQELTVCTLPCRKFVPQEEREDALSSLHLDVHNKRCSREPVRIIPMFLDEFVDRQEFNMCLPLDVAIEGCLPR